MSDNFLLNYDDIVQVATYPSIRVDKYNEFSYHNCNLATEARIIQTVTDITQDIVRDVRAASQLNPTKSAFHAAQLQMMSKRLSSRHITATHVIITGISAVLLTPAAKENLYHTLDKIFDQLKLGETYLIADQIRSCNPMTDGSVSPNGSQPPTQSLIFKLSTPIYTDCPYRVTRIMREPLHIKTSTGNITELYSRMSTTSAPTDHTVSSASKQLVEFVHTANLCTRKQSDGVSTGSVIAAYRSPSINTATIDTIGHTIAAHAASCTNHPHTIIVLPGVSSLQLNNEHFPRYTPELFVLVFSHTTDVSVNNSIQKAMSVPMSPSEWNKERKFLYGNWIHLDARPSVENFHLAPLSDNARLQKFELLLVTLPSPNIPISTLLAAVPVIPQFPYTAIVNAFPLDAHIIVLVFKRDPTQSFTPIIKWEAASTILHPIQTPMIRTTFKSTLPIGIGWKPHGFLNIGKEQVKPHSTTLPRTEPGYTSVTPKRNQRTSSNPKSSSSKSIDQYYSGTPRK